MQNLLASESSVQGNEKKAVPARQLSSKQRQQLFSQLRQEQQPKQVLSSGFPTLDAQLGGGWPQGCVIEILGNNAIQPLLPLLSTLCQQKKQLAWIHPPHTPYLPALLKNGLVANQQLFVQPEKTADVFWCMEQLLRTAACGAVLCWQEPYQQHTLRRLQLAAEAGDSFALLFRSSAAQNKPSAAAVRLLLERQNGELHGRLLKVRGGIPGPAMCLEPSSTAANLHEH